MNRQQQLAGAFVALADTLADDFDPVVLLRRLAEHCVDVVGADTAGVMVANARNARGALRVMAVSDERAALTELFRLQTDEGPCLDCYSSQQAVDTPDLADVGERWAHWAPLARRGGGAAPAPPRPGGGRARHTP
ncbi:hypothetical protein ACFWW0_31970, partial [Streptomyces violascens]